MLSSHHFTQGYRILIEPSGLRSEGANTFMVPNDRQLRVLVRSRSVHGFLANCQTDMAIEHNPLIEIQREVASKKAPLRKWVVQK
jgi:hypothetical protein